MTRPLGKRIVHSHNEAPRLAGIQPAASSDGVTFIMTYEGRDYPCIVSSEALLDLWGAQGPALEPLNAYRQNSARILGVAGRLIRAGIDASPIVLQVGAFHQGLATPR